MSSSLSVVIPAYNEALRLPATLRRLVEHLSEREGHSEIVVVDDGSTDGTGALAGECLSSQARVSFRVIEGHGNRGKGYAVRAGMAAAAGDLLLFSDADLSTPIEDLRLLEAALARGFDAAIGSRGRPQSDVQVHQGRLREGMGRVFNLFTRIFFLPGICDTQCGFKLFRRGYAERVFPLSRIDGWAFDVEVLSLGQRLGYRVAEVPVRWRNQPASKVPLVGGPASMLLELLRIRYGLRSSRLGRILPSAAPGGA